MSRKNARRLALVLTLTGSLTLVPAAARALPSGSVPGSGPAVSGLADVWVLSQPWGSLARAWGASDEGIMIDPDGNHATSEGDGDEGIMIDPNG